MVQTARRYIEIEVEAADALRSLRGIEDASRGTERALSGLQRQLQTMGSAFQAFVGFLGAQELIGFADAAADIEQRLLAVTGSVAESNAIFEELLNITNRLGVGVVELAGSFAQLSTALPERGSREIVEALDTVSVVLSTTGAGAQQVNAVLLQLNQALASNVLQGDEFLSVYENAPVLLKAWQQAAGLTSQSLKELSATGALTTDIFFELLPQIREIAVEMTGMEQPALTIARAFEILRSNVIALFKDSNAVSVVMSTLAGAIVFVAENLDLLVTAALAFTALKLPGYLLQIGQRLGFFAEGVSLLTGLQRAFTPGTDVWLTLAEYMDSANRSTVSMASAFGTLRSAINSTVGQFVVLFAVFESWNWAIDRINEASRAMDLLVERAKNASEETSKFVERFTEIRDLNVDTSSYFELEQALTFANASITKLQANIRDAENEFSGLVNAAGNVSFETRVFNPEAAARADFLAQQIFSMRRELEIAEIVSENYNQALQQMRDEFEAVEDSIPSFDELTKELDAFTDIRQRAGGRRLQIEAELQLIGLDEVEKTRAEISQIFDEPFQKAGLAIEEARGRIEQLIEAFRFARSRDESEKLAQAIAEQNAIIEEHAEIMRAVRIVRLQEEDSLVRQATALEQAKVEQEAYVEALKLTGQESASTFEVQFALQDLYDQGVISLEQLTQALGELDAEAQSQNLEGLVRSQEALNQALVGIEQEAAIASDRLRAYTAAGTEGLTAFDSIVRMQRSFEQALRDQETTLEKATPAQLAYAEAVAAAQQSIERSERALRAAERNRELASALAGVQREALGAQEALDAFTAGGETGLAVFEHQKRLQETFTEALQAQGVTFRTATQEQLNYARAATRALEDQLQAQDELNRAQRESQAILDARARIESIGGITVTEVQDFGDIGRIVDDITSRAVNGNRAAAQELFGIAEENLRRLAEDVEGPFAERELERAKRELQQIVDLVFREPQIPPGSQVLDAEIAAAAELAVPTLVAPIVFDPKSVDEATEALQARLSAQSFTIQVIPELVGLAVDDVVAEAVNQEGAAPA